MINLIPPEEQIIFKLRTQKKITFIICFLITFLFFCLIISFIGIKYYVDTGLNYQKNILDSYKKEQKISEISEIQKKISSVNKVLDQIDSFYTKRPLFSRAVKRISNILPPNSYLEVMSVNYSESDDKMLKVFLTGFIYKREDLFNFKKSLEKESGIKEVTFPSSNWLKSENIEFQASFKIGQ